MRYASNVRAANTSSEIAFDEFANVVECGVDPDGDGRTVWFENSQGDVGTRSFVTADQAETFFDMISH